MAYPSLPFPARATTIRSAPFALQMLIKRVAAEDNGNAVIWVVMPGHGFARFERETTDERSVPVRLI